MCNNKHINKIKFLAFTSLRRLTSLAPLATHARLLASCVHERVRVGVGCAPFNLCQRLSRRLYLLEIVCSYTLSTFFSGDYFYSRRLTFVRFLSLCQIACALLCVPHAHGDGDDDKIYGSEMLFNAHKIITKIFVPIANRTPEPRAANADCHVVAHCCRSPKDALQIELFKSPSEICTRKFHGAVVEHLPAGLN